MIVNGIRISEPPQLFLELATEIEHPWLVAVGDALVLNPRHPDPRSGHPFTTLEALTQALAIPGRRGRREAIRALARVRLGAESPRETLLRILLEDAGLPPAQCGYPVHDGFGHLIGWFDLVWPEFSTIAEYDGDQHRTNDVQYDRDITRFDRATEAGWRVVRVRKRGLDIAPAETVRRTTTALLAGGWTP